MGNGNGRVPAKTALAGVVALTGLLVAAVIGVNITGDSNASTPLITAIIALVSAAVPGLVAAGIAENTKKELNNGLVEGKVTNVLRETGVIQAAEDTRITTPAALDALRLVLEKSNIRADVSENRADASENRANANDNRANASETRANATETRITNLEGEGNHGR